jgi:hypothetical protein
MRTYFLYFLLLLVVSPLTEIPLKLILIYGRLLLGELGFSLFWFMWVFHLTNYSKYHLVINLSISFLKVK